MRILRAIRSVNPEGGGPIEGIIQVSRALVRSGHEVELISLDAPDDPWVRSCPLPVYARGRGGTDYGYSREYVPWLKQHGAKYHAIVVSGLWQFHGLGAWLALRPAGVPYYVFPHGMLDPWFKRAHPLKHLKKWLYWPWAEYRVLRDARAVLFTCHEEQRLARESFWLYHCRERVVTYGTAAPPGNPPAQRELFLARFPGLRQKRLLLFLGRIHPKKGCDALLRGFQAFLAQQPPRPGAQPWHLVFAGPDAAGWRRDLEDEAARCGVLEHLTFTGMLKDDLKWGAFHAAELFALPSHQENFGIAVVEALACGLPVIVGEAVNIWKEIVDAKAGWACAPTADAVKAALLRWTALDEGERERTRQRARACFAQHFEIGQVARSLLAALNA